MRRVNGVRLDKWLWAVRIYKTRSRATEACRSGHVKIDGQSAKPAHEVRVNEMLAAHVGDITRTIRVLGLLDRRVGAAVARQYMTDLTPAAEYAKAREPDFRRPLFRPKGLGRPTKKDRRALEKMSRDAVEGSAAE
jgi:ribosome-associated heat shock protein Hsp15